MIGNLTRGQKFMGLLKYLFGETKDAVIVGGNMAGRDARSLMREFAAAVSANQRVKKPVLHISLALPRGEDVPVGRWNEIAFALLKILDLGQNRPWLLVEHFDTKHRHVHLVTSRVGYDGKVWVGAWQIWRLLDAKAQIEKQFGLTATPVVRSDGPTLKDRVLNGLSRKLKAGEEVSFPPLTALREAIDRAIEASKGPVEDFQRALGSRGVEAVLNKSKSTGRISGASFRFEGGTWLKGSTLGKNYRWAAIMRRLAAPVFEATVSAATNQISPIKNESERTPPAVRLERGALEANSITTAGPGDIPSAGHRNTPERSEDASGPVCLPYFPRIGSQRTGANSHREREDAATADRTIESDYSVDFDSPAIGVALFAALRRLIRAAVEVLKGQRLAVELDVGLTSEALKPKIPIYPNPDSVRELARDEPNIFSPD